MERVTRVHSECARIARPGVAGFWAYLAALARVSGTPFGANPHALVLP